MRPMLSIAILDDDNAILRALSLALSSGGHYNVTLFSNPSGILEKLAGSMPEILICDLNLPGTDGISLIRKIKEMQGRQPEIIIITGYGKKEHAIECLRLGAIDFLEKPFSMSAFIASVERAATFVKSKQRFTSVRHVSDKGENTEGEETGLHLEGVSPAIERVRQLIGMIARTNDTSVLITGETGTGKEVVARLIHEKSHRQRMPFFAKNCASVPEHLFESEFFGHVKGSFTGAFSDRKGWFEYARNSTLFLDEISEIPLHVQPKLLRVLEEKTVSPVGSTRETGVDVRIIAASNADLAEECLKGRFRRDLFYRLNIFSIHLPPLRKRQEDLLPLFKYFLRQAANRHGCSTPRTGKGLEDILIKHSFPGNVRELRNLAEKIVIMTGEEDITSGMINAMINGGVESPVTLHSRSDNLRDNEIRLVNQALSEAGFVIAKAARSLNITSQSLLRRMKKYNISIPPSRLPESE